MLDEIDRSVRDILEDLLNNHRVLLDTFPNREGRNGMKNQIRDRACAEIMEKILIKE